jgi:hypothetical protein
MPAGTASSGDGDDVAVGYRRNRGERQRVGAADEGTKDEGSGDQSVHEASPVGLTEIVGHHVSEAFSSEVAAGSREENASKQEASARVPIQSERKRL